MRTVEIDTLREKLAEYVKLAESGETIFITDGDLVVAELRPSERMQPPIPAEPSLDDLVRSGVMSPPSVRSSTPPPKPPPVAGFDQVMQELAESREDRLSTPLHRSRYGIF